MEEMGGGELDEDRAWIVETMNWMVWETPALLDFSGIPLIGEISQTATGEHIALTKSSSIVWRGDERF